MARATSEKKARWWKEPSLNDAELEHLRSKIGTEFKVMRPPRGGRREATWDTIMDFIDGLGDSNPLWSNEEYAKKTRYGGLVAPPSFLYAVTTPAATLGLHGVHAFLSGDDWEFYKPIHVGDRIFPVCTFAGFDEKSTDFASRWVIEHFDTKYSNQKGELVAKAVGNVIRADRSSIKEKGKYSKLQLPHPWTEEQVKKIIDEELAEHIRGSNVRYWEDVKEGEKIPTLVKGPVSMTDEIAWVHGSPAYCFMANSVALRWFRDHPGYAMFHPTSHAYELIEVVHWDTIAAETTGVPYPYDLGPQRQSWLMQSVTNWMGDEGWLKKNSAQHRRFVYLSDVVRVNGKVTRKYIDESGEHCVDIESAAINQREETVLVGRNTVALPSRDKNTWPVASRLSSKQR